MQSNKHTIEHHIIEKAIYSPVNSLSRIDSVYTETRFFLFSALASLAFLFERHLVFTNAFVVESRRLIEADLHDTAV